MVDAVDVVAVLSLEQAERVAIAAMAMGAPAWTNVPRYQDLHAMGRDYPDEVDALITPWLMRHTRAELLELSEQKQVEQEF